MIPHLFLRQPAENSSVISSRANGHRSSNSNIAGQVDNVTILHPDTAFRNLTADGGWVIRAVNAVMRHAQPEPHHAERAAGVRDFTDDHETACGRWSVEFPNSDRIGLKVFPVFS